MPISPRPAGQVSDDEQTEAAAFTDLDADGWVDSYAANIGRPRPGSALGGASPSIYLQRAGPVLHAMAPADLGIAPPFGQSAPERGLSCADYDNDGKQDIFTGRYHLAENLLWRNWAGRTSRTRRAWQVAPGSARTAAMAIRWAASGATSTMTASWTCSSATGSTSATSTSADKSQLLIAGEREGPLV